MKNKKKLGILVLSALVMIAIPLFIGQVHLNVENTGISKVVFFVS